MKKNLLIVFVLMAVCVTGVTALQLYFSYQTYQTESKVFERNINEALNEAVDTAFEKHRLNVIRQFKGWLADTTIIDISCKWNAGQKVTVFTISEVEAPRADRTTISLSIEQFPQKLEYITPQAKAVLIEQMADMVNADLKKGSIYFYTQKLGARLDKAYDKTPITVNDITPLYKASLQKRNIREAFTFNQNDKDNYTFNTKKVNFAIRRPYKETWLYASFNNTGLYLLGQLKWVLFGALLLVIITIICFWYTVRVLLSQQKLNALKDDFISNMTHEIHTPLTSITVTAQALKQFSHDPEAQQSYLDIIVYQSNKLAGLTDEILTSARLAKIDMGLNDTIAVDNLINEIVKSTSGVGIHFSPCAQNTVVRGNKSHLLRAIGNLVDNAIKHGNAFSKIDISCLVSDKSINIAVADNGPGIPDEYKHKVFEQFFRIPLGNVHNVKGYGLGLSYVKKVAEAHGGTVSITDNVPNGSIFTITLPL
ncbi:HAMP domain-containing histidine kinase [Flavobacterium zepuense]|uniref:histidine kinase n=1 Tax=Flavobacterium zepuense TaxID=2593302 RepID=A0A552V7R6_9FLAO|nr:HAMP domain-containing sensor histidine kinase [Flavobacterium zepuense]TRW26505.1 HAMP domain-containing histidine kinase [Flavobacterium zepuense]